MAKGIVLLAVLLCALPVTAAEKPAGTDLGAVTGGNLQPARRLIEDKCVACHSKERIEAAERQQKSMAAIMKQMENKGVVLTDKERRVLQHFWEAKAFKK